MVKNIQIVSYRLSENQYHGVIGCRRVTIQPPLFGLVT